VAAPGVVVVEGCDEGLGAAVGAVGADLDVGVGACAVAGVAGVKDLLAGGDGVALVDVVGGAVAVGPLGVLVVEDGEPDAAGVVGVVVVGVGGVGVVADDFAGVDGVDGCAGGDDPVPGGVVVVGAVEWVGGVGEGLVGAG
jgi:hypothetical protein